jgi:hypothetical protein
MKKAQYFIGIDLHKTVIQGIWQARRWLRHANRLL